MKNALTTRERIAVLEEQVRRFDQRIRRLEDRVRSLVHDIAQGNRPCQ